MADVPLSDAETMMWRLQRTPGMSSTFGSISLLDRSPKLATLRQRMATAAAAIPRLRSTIHDDDNPLNPPVWRLDPDFNIDDHVRHIALPAPGRLTDLYELAGQIINDPLDPHKPQWQFVVIDGIRGGAGGPTSALVQRTHHAIADGEASIEMSMYFLDLERNAKQPLIGNADAVTDDEAAESNEGGDGGSNVWRDLTNGLRLTAHVAKGLRGAISDPGALAGQLTDSSPAKSPLWVNRSLRRQIHSIDLPMAPLRDAARRLGGTL
ncbi:MAG TPA: wax ester/triacylglycerol synthase family O-acyltransferase, partial [Ilumatobacteraceae bacterium]|nr:wax ester/triacylglycerol synthase family O-acyltransferase [Ilumatobacteraceae bacterium]